MGDVVHDPAQRHRSHRRGGAFFVTAPGKRRRLSFIYGLARLPVLIGTDRPTGGARMKRVVLHVGLPKTGSSAIQAMLRANEDVLAQDHGTRLLLAPELKPLYRAITSLAQASPPALLPRLRLQLAVRALRRRIATDPATRIVLSHEMILGFNSGSMFRTRFEDGPAQAIAALRRVFRGHDLHWVIYERDPAHQKRSAYNQNVKIRHVVADFATWQRENCPPSVFDRLVADLREALGDRLTVLDFDTGRRDDGPFGAQILSLAGLSPAVIRDLEAAHAVNESLPPELLDLKRRFNTLGLSNKVGREVMKLLEEAHRLPPPQTGAGPADVHPGADNSRAED
jgi:hypothetical protein